MKQQFIDWAFTYVNSMLYYEDYYDKYDIDKSGLDEYQLQGLTNKYKAFTPPRRIPTYFCVSK